ncbi:unnamed protein product [Ilex paraguariensis]|uniref:C2 NT-type domain-containing protein n=1 Tax=Ilex paraguariensis TaxID=185542 RepID=A0ABC8SXQ6_9AQUA
MFLGPRKQKRKSPSVQVQVDYLIHIQEIKPWPPSQSLRSVRSVLIQWEHGEKNSGSTNQVVPLLGNESGVGDGRIEFNEIFRLPVTLLKEMSIKGGDRETFQKNYIEFNLYEPRRDKTLKGQLLGIAIVDMADYGVVKESVSISAPINCKRSYGNTAQPLLFLKIQPVDKSHVSSSSNSLIREAKLDRNGGEYGSALTNEEYTREAEIASFTDDDASSHSSLAVSSSAIEWNGSSRPQQPENGKEVTKDGPGEAIDKHVLDSEQGLAISDEKPMTESLGSPKDSSSCSSSTDLSSDPVFISDKTSACSVQSSSLSIAYGGTDKELNTKTRSNFQDDLAEDIQVNGSVVRNGTKGAAQLNTRESTSNGFSAKVASPDVDVGVDEQLRFGNYVGSQLNGDDDEKASNASIQGFHKSESADIIEKGSTEDKNRQRHQKNGHESKGLEEEMLYIEDKPLNTFSLDNSRSLFSLGSDTLSVSRENLLTKGDIPNGDRLKNVKSVRSPMDATRSNGSVSTDQFVEKVKDVIVQVETQNGARSTMSNGKKDANFCAQDTRNIISDSKIQKLEHRIKVLEGELREVAAIEVGLYSIVAEHGSSTNKVHAPARRLSRLYLHACKGDSPSRRASAARSAVSGLVLVSKACGNDVPRLTFWLSNSVVLRGIMKQAFRERNLQLSAGPFVKSTGDGKGNNKELSQLKWESFDSFPSKDTGGALCESFDDWEDVDTFTTALEKIEAWIFSRIIESIWWQTLTPHMQSAAANAINRSTSSDLRKIYQKTSSSSDQEQGNCSIDLWKKAYRDACERICPVRAGGHECGCLPVLSRLIMEQCVARLDVAMFNAILRECADDLPTDPVSDPISDAKVLPIPGGKASFGAGAQLKNAIGNWSRWLSDVFGIEEDDSLEDENGPDNSDGEETKECVNRSFKSFHLLNALSDLMMLPKDMLLSRSIRKEVCPMFGAPLIRRVLNTFVPDEFCPDLIPEVLLEALNSEDPFETRENLIINVPCAAAPIAYLPPSADSFTGILGNIGSQAQLTRSGSSILKKSHTSDDELEELDSPLISIIDNFKVSPTSTKPSWMSKENGSNNAVRYQLLRKKACSGRGGPY